MGPPPQAALSLPTAATVCAVTLALQLSQRWVCRPYHPLIWLTAPSERTTTLRAPTGAASTTTTTTQPILQLQHPRLAARRQPPASNWLKSRQLQPVQQRSQGGSPPAQSTRSCRLPRGLAWRQIDRWRLQVQLHSALPCLPARCLGMHST
jgi:hypothetical protein